MQRSHNLENGLASMKLMKMLDYNLRLVLVKNKQSNLYFFVQKIKC